MLPAFPHERLELARGLGARGLFPGEVEDMRRRYGTNRIAQEDGVSNLQLMRAALADPMIWFLLGTSALFGLSGALLDMIILLAAIVPIIAMDLYLHRRTSASVAAIGDVMATKATVVRGSETRVINALDVVVGDLLLVEKGDAIPADGMLLSGSEVQLDEAVLTGEGYPVAKSADCEGEVPGPSQWLYAGTRLLTGHLRMRALQTGGETAFGAICQALGEPERRPSRLQLAVGRLVRLLVFVAAGFCLALFAIRLAQGFGWLDAVLSAAALAMAAIPEEFPVVLTFFLAAGVYRLARRGVLVRQSAAVETLGRVSVICADKTGTITQGVLSVDRFEPSGNEPAFDPEVIAALSAYPFAGDPLDRAMRERFGSPASGWEQLALEPFTEQRRVQSATWQGEGRSLRVFKGAPETLLARCSLDENELRARLRRVDELAAMGRKVIAIAFADGAAGEPSDEAAGLTFAGLVTFVDALKPGAVDALAEAHAARVGLVMVTGDHPETALAIARESGLARRGTCLTGDELEQRLEQHQALPADLEIVARASPMHKLMLVRHLREHGEVVAVLGDGVNDAPALQEADVGVAMGRGGTRTAREVSGVVLLKDDLATLVEAVADGRRILEGLRRSFAFLLAVHMPLVICAALLPALGFPLPFLPAQIVWLELIIHPSAILGFQRFEGDRPAARRDLAQGTIFDTSEWLAIIATGLCITMGLAALFLFAASPVEDAPLARGALMTGFCFAIAMLLLLLRGRGSTAAVTIAAATAGSAATLIQMPWAANWLSLAPLPGPVWLAAAALGCACALVPGIWLDRKLAGVREPSPAAGGLSGRGTAESAAI